MERLDREQKTFYTLRAQARDRATNRLLEPESEFIIKVQDINDSEPRFLHGPYIGSVAELSPTGGLQSWGGGLGEGKGEGKLPGSEWEPALRGAADNLGRDGRDRSCYSRAKSIDVSPGAYTGSCTILGTVTAAHPDRGTRVTSGTYMDTVPT